MYIMQKIHSIKTHDLKTAQMTFAFLTLSFLNIIIHASIWNDGNSESFETNTQQSIIAMFITGLILHAIARTKISEIIEILNTAASIPIVLGFIIIISQNMMDVFLPFKDPYIQETTRDINKNSTTFLVELLPTTVAISTTTMLSTQGWISCCRKIIARILYR